MSINLTNLVAQVQARIDGLTGTETLKDLLILSKAAEGLDVDRTSLDAALQTFITAFDGTTDEKDLLVANKSLIAENSNVLYKGLDLDPSVTWNSGSGSTQNIAFVPVSVTGVDISGAEMVDIISVNIPEGKQGLLMYAAFSTLTTTANQTNLELEVDGVVRCSYGPLGNNNNQIVVIGSNSGNFSINRSYEIPPILVKQNVTMRIRKATQTNASAQIVIPLLEI